jgi:hypothetical protein
MNTHIIYMDQLQRFFQSQPKQQILDPMSCLVRLALLKYKDPSTKVSVYDNSIQYNQPGIFQGMIRNFNGDKREDIHNIYQPLLKAIEWYDISDETYKYLFQKCLEGIDCLVTTYSKHSIVHTTLQHYRKLISDTIEQKEIIEYEKDIKESPLINELHDFWDKDEIMIIYQLLQINDKQTDTIYLKNIEDILTMKEHKLYQFIQTSSSSYF